MFDFDATLPLMAVQFLVLTVILNFIFYKPLTQAIDERTDYVRNNLSEAKQRAEKANQLAAQYEQELAETRRQSQALIAAAQAEATKIASAEIAAAQQEVQAQLLQAQQELDQQKQTALTTLEAQVSDLSRQLLTKLLGAELVG